MRAPWNVKQAALIGGGAAGLMAAINVLNEFSLQVEPSSLHLLKVITGIALGGMAGAFLAVFRNRRPHR